MIDYDTFASEVQSSIEALRTTILDPSDQLRLLPGVYISMQQYTGLASQLIRQSLLSAMTRTVAAIDFQSSTEAQQALDTLVPLFDFEIALANDINAFEALRELKSALVNDITTRGLQLPDLIIKAYRKPLPSIVIAHDLYLDPSRADEIVLRNDPVHPLFCQTSLEVLSS